MFSSFQFFSSFRYRYFLVFLQNVIDMNYDNTYDDIMIRKIANAF